jgi:hypothetical protein
LLDMSDLKAEKLVMFQRRWVKGEKSWDVACRNVDL